MFKRIFICAVAFVFLFTQLSFLYIPASADFPHFSSPDLDNYPDTLEGAMAFVGDTFSAIALDSVGGLCNAVLWPLDSTLGSVFEDKFGTNPYDIPEENFYDIFSDYYSNHGHSGGGGIRDGSPTMDYSGDYSWQTPTSSDAVYIDDGMGGFFTVIDNSHIELPYKEVMDFHVYHHGKEVIKISSSYSNKLFYENTSNTPSKPHIDYGVYTLPDSANACFWAIGIASYESYVGATPYSGNAIWDTSQRYTISRTYYVKESDGSLTPITSEYVTDPKRYYYTIKDYSLPVVQNNSTTLYTYNPVTNNFGDTYYYGADDNGQPCLYDSNNNSYNFNADGTFGSGNLYLIPDFSTLNEGDYINLVNKISNYYMSCYLKLASKADKNNSDLYPYLTNILNRLNGVNSSISSVNSNLSKVSTSLKDTNDLLEQINEGIILLSKNPTTAADNEDIIILLTELKKGLVGDSEPYKLDQIIDLLEKIVENTSEDLTGDHEDYDIDWYIQTIPDLVRSKVDFSSYFIQLSNVLNLLFGSGFDDVDYAEYFDTDNYIVDDSSTEETSSYSVLAACYSSAEPSTSDYPDVFGEELASADVPISSSYYLTSAVAASGVTDESISTPAPVLNVTIWGEDYNLFSYLTPEVHDKIIPLKRLLSIFLYAFYLLWIIKRLPSLLGDKGIGDY